MLRYYTSTRCARSETVPCQLIIFFRQVRMQIKMVTHPLIVDKLVHATWSQSRPHGIDNRHAGIDVGDELWLALAGVSPLLKENDLRLDSMIHGGSCHLAERWYSLYRDSWKHM